MKGFKLLGMELFKSEMLALITTIVLVYVKHFLPFRRQGFYERRKSGGRKLEFPVQQTALSSEHTHRGHGDSLPAPTPWVTQQPQDLPESLYFFPFSLSGAKWRISCSLVNFTFYHFLFLCFLSLLLYQGKEDMPLYSSVSFSSF